MVSYCANAQQVGNIDLKDIFPTENENLPMISDEVLTEFQEEQVNKISEMKMYPSRYYRNC